MDRGLLTLNEVAEYFQMSRSTIYRLVQNDKIPAIRIGSHWRFKKDVLDEWLDERLKQGVISSQSKLPTREDSKGK